MFTYRAYVLAQVGTGMIYLQSLAEALAKWGPRAIIGLVELLREWDPCIICTAKSLRPSGHNYDCIVEHNSRVDLTLLFRRGIVAE